MQEALNEWLILDEENMNFHMRQYGNPYRSTVKFSEFLKRRNARGGNYRILDLGCGAGAVLGYLLASDKRFSWGYGIDINKNLVDIGNKILKERGIYNCKLVEGDFFDMDISVFGKINGVVSLQTFNILPDYTEIVKCMCKLSPEWMGFSMLGFEGLIDYKIKLSDYTKGNGGSEVFYNIYSLPRMKEFFSCMGYSKFEYEEFVIDIDLARANPMGRGTYTVKTEQGKRMQISGGMMMPWYFVYVEK